MSRPRGVLAIGDRVVIDGVSHVLVGVSGTAIRLASADGAVAAPTTVTELLAVGNVAIPGAGVARRMPVVGAGRLAGRCAGGGLVVGGAHRRGGLWAAAGRPGQSTAETAVRPGTHSA